MILRCLDRRLNSRGEDLVVSQLEVLKSLVVELGKPHWAFDLVLVEDNAMLELNHQFRGKDSVTDVLSFSYLLDGGQGSCDLKAGTRGAKHDLWVDPLASMESEGDTIQVGEVILAPSFITTRCLERQWAVENEFPLLVVHGGLHLLGWDHQDDVETRAMRDLELKFLASSGLSHPLHNAERLDR